MRANTSYLLSHLVGGNFLDFIIHWFLNVFSPAQKLLCCLVSLFCISSYFARARVSFYAMSQQCCQLKTKVDRRSILIHKKKSELYFKSEVSVEKVNVATVLQVLITNKKVYFVKNREPDHDNIILIVDYSDLISVSVISSNEERKIATNVDYGTNIFLELTMKSVSFIQTIKRFRARLVQTQPENKGVI